MTYQFIKIIVVIIVMILLCNIQEIFAYNILYTNSSGEPIKWDNTKTIKYWLDPGDLGALTNDQAHTLLQEAMNIWENVLSAKVPRFEFAGYLPEDIEGTNYQDYVSLDRCYTDELDYCEIEGYRNFKTVIIFDNNKTILENELCRIGSCSAYSSPKVFARELSEDVSEILQGIAVFNGTHYSNNPDAMIALFTHELGHLLGLGHSPINQQLFVVNLSDNIDDRIYFPTMESNTRYETATTISFGATLNPDDIAGISILYPSDDFETQTGAISGTIYKSDGTPMEHINVVARDIDDPMCNVYSVVSGRYCSPTSGPLTTYCTFENGDFIIEGLSPGSYTIEVEDIADEQNMNFTYHYLAGDAEFWNEGDVADEDPYLRTVITVGAGEIVEGVDVVLNRSEVTDDRVKYIPIEEFDIPLTTSCTDSAIDYSELIGLVNNSATTSAGGCSL